VRVRRKERDGPYRASPQWARWRACGGDSGGGGGGGSPQGWGKAPALTPCPGPDAGHRGSVHTAARSVGALRQGRGSPLAPPRGARQGRPVPAPRKEAPPGPAPPPGPRPHPAWPAGPWRARAAPAGATAGAPAPSRRARRPCLALCARGAVPAHLPVRTCTVRARQHVRSEPWQLPDLPPRVCHTAESSIVRAS
jgi:hypothetical protein